MVVSDADRDTGSFPRVQAVHAHNTEPSPYGMVHMQRSWGPMPGSVDQLHSALLVTHEALREAGMWPYGVPLAEGRQALSMAGVYRLLESNGVTLVTNVDLGPEHFGVVLYPTATIMVNARYFADYASTPRLFFGLRLMSVVLFAIYLLCPPYADAIYLPIDFGVHTERDQLWSVWRTALWSGMEMLATGPMIHALYERGEHRLNTVDPRRIAGYYRDPLFAYCAVEMRHPLDEQQIPPVALRLAEIAGIAPYTARAKYLATLKGVADTMANEHYADYERVQDWFPFSSAEVAHAYATTERYWRQVLPDIHRYLLQHWELRQEMGASQPDDAEFLRSVEHYRARAVAYDARDARDEPRSSLFRL